VIASRVWEGTAALLLVFTLILWLPACDSDPHPSCSAAAGSALLEDAADYPIGIEVIHSPDSAAAIEGGPSGRAYSWVYQTTVRTLGGPIRVTEFGGYHLAGDRWIFGNYTGEPFTEEHFIAWYSGIDSCLRPGHTYTDRRNWSGSSTSHPGRAKWVFVGLDVKGRPVKGEAVVELLGHIDSVSVAMP
jgi:hypothetical protein